jgi:hypothetical protein
MTHPDGCPIVAGDIFILRGEALANPSHPITAYVVIESTEDQVMLESDTVGLVFKSVEKLVTAMARVR